MPRRARSDKKPWHKKEQQKPGSDKVTSELNKAPNDTLYGPLLREIHRIGKGVKETQEEYIAPPPTNPYFKQ